MTSPLIDKYARASSGSDSQAGALITNPKDER